MTRFQRPIPCAVATHSQFTQIISLFYTMKLIKVVKSANPQKKQDAVFEVDGRERKISFGAAGMSDFTLHNDEERKQRQLARHRVNENWQDPLTAGALSRWILWNKPTLRASIQDFKQRFNL